MNMFNSLNFVYFVYLIFMHTNTSHGLSQQFHLRNLGQVSSKTHQESTTALTSFLDEGLIADLIFSFITPNDLYNVGLTSRQNFESCIRHGCFSKKIDEGMELIKKSNDDLSDELSESAQQLKEFLETLPFIPTKYVTYAYIHKKREALSLFVQYNVVFDM